MVVKLRLARFGRKVCHEDAELRPHFLVPASSVWEKGVSRQETPGSFTLSETPTVLCRIFPSTEYLRPTPERLEMDDTLKLSATMTLFQVIVCFRNIYYWTSLLQRLFKGSLLLQPRMVTNTSVSMSTASSESHHTGFVNALAENQGFAG